jgi:hypothetical protein
VFLRHLDAFAQALGVENAPIVFDLAQVPWPSDELRDEFIKDLSGIDMKEVSMYA